jgi:putative ABC transport system substrate-binding protein
LHERARAGEFAPAKPYDELGYVEGQNIRYEYRSDQGQVSRLPELAAELMRLDVDLIVTWFTPAARRR